MRPQRRPSSHETLAFDKRGHAGARSAGMTFLIASPSAEATCIPVYGHRENIFEQRSSFVKVQRFTNFISGRNAFVSPIKQRVHAGMPRKPTADVIGMSRQNSILIFVEGIRNGNGSSFRHVPVS